MAPGSPDQRMKAIIKSESGGQIMMQTAHPKHKVIV